MKNHITSCTLALAFSTLLPMGAGAMTLYSDDFNRDNGAWGTAVTGGNWTTGNSGGAVSWNIGSIATPAPGSSVPNVGVMDVSTVTVNSATAYLSLGGGFTLDSYNSYTFATNMRFVRSGQQWAAIDSNKTAAYVLGATDSNFYEAGNGYAVWMTGSNSASDNRIEFGRYTGGVATGFTSLISYNIGATAPDSAFTLQITFGAASNQWEMFVDAAAFGTTATTSRGTAIDSTFKNASLAYAGFLSGKQGNIGNDYLFDNLSAMAVPEPSAFAILLGGLGALALLRRRRH